MTFQEAVEATPHLDGAWMVGLQALRARDRDHIEPEDPRRLCGSVNIDGALEQHQPNANRWDYALGYRHSNRTEDCVYWVEMHTAEDREVAAVLRKRDWLIEWLKGDGRRLAQFECDIVWVSSGLTSFLETAPVVKRLAEKGILYRSRRLRIPSQRTGD